MTMASKALEGAAFAAGVGAFLFGGTEKVLELGHYTATGLRKAADGIDYVTDAGQDFCHKRKENCAARKQEFLDRAAMSEQEAEEALREAEAMFCECGEANTNESVEAEIVEEDKGADLKERFCEKPQQKTVDDAILV